MKRALWILPLLCSLAFAQGLGGKAGIGGKAGMGGGPSVGANPAFVQGAANHTSSGTTVAVTVSAVGAGHGLFVFCIGSSSCTVPTATGETFSTATGTSGCQNFGGDNAQCWWTASAAGGETAVNCNAPSGDIRCGVVEFTRPQGLSTPNDAGGNSFNAGATSYTVSTSAATTNPNDFVIDCFGSDALGNNQFTLTGGFTSAFSSVDAFGQMRCGYLVTSSTGTQTGTATVVSSMRATGIIMAFKP